MSRHTVPVLAVMLVLAALSAPAHADDGGIAFGGSPRLLNGHPTVSMQSEVVRMIIEPETVRVDCQFVFRNDGPACKVRMGFPDQGRDSMIPNDGEPQKHPTGTFTSYSSYVDGVKSFTETIRGDQPNNVWHAKMVTFPAQAVRRVRDIYTVPLGGAIIERGSISDAYYILHTGSSWHGVIGRAEVDVTFAPGTIPTPLVPTPLTVAPGNDAEKYAWPTHPHGTIVYRGPSVPTIQGRTLRFVRVNFKPSYLDDVLLSFGYHPISNQ